jgi:uncharacterized Zn finger protein
MKISTVIRNLVDSNVRSKGKMYADWAQAKTISHSKFNIEATVKGSAYKTYNVLINIGESRIEVFCTCTYFNSSGTCKHIWATIITAKKDGFDSDAVTQDAVLVGQNEEIVNNDFEDDKDYSGGFEQSTLESKNTIRENSITAPPQKNNLIRNPF